MLRVTEQIIADAVTLDETVRLANGMLAKRVNAARLFEPGNEDAAEHAHKMARYFRDHIAKFDPRAVGYFVLQGGMKLQPLFPWVTCGVSKVKSGFRDQDLIGEPSSEQRAFLVEDVLTTGGSTMRAIDTLKHYGIGVEFVFALIDRKIGAVERLRRQGINVVCVADVPAYEERRNVG